MENVIRTTALNICGAFYALWKLCLNWVGRLYWRIFRGSLEKQSLKAIRTANKLAKETGYKYMVLNYRGRIIIKPKKVIKHMLACKGKYFRKGATIQDIERIALYITR